MINAILSLFGDALPTPTAPQSTPEGFDRLLRGAVAAHTHTTAPAELNVGTPDRSVSGLSPELRARLGRVIARMRDEHGHDVALVEGRRSGARQDYLFGQGRERPGPVVTWTRDSKHETGRAADLIVDGGYEDVEAYRTLQRVAREEGLHTLGLIDPGHVELDRGHGTEALDDRWPLVADSTGASVNRDTPVPVATVQTNAAAVAVAAPASVARVAAVARVARPARPSAPRTQVDRPAPVSQPGSAVEGPAATAARTESAKPGPGPVPGPGAASAPAPGSDSAAGSPVVAPTPTPTPTLAPVSSVAGDGATRMLDFHYRVTVLHTSTEGAASAEGSTRPLSERTPAARPDEGSGHGSAPARSQGGDATGDGESTPDQRRAAPGITGTPSDRGADATRAAVAAAGRELGRELRPRSRRVGSPDGRPDRGADRGADPARGPQVGVVRPDGAAGSSAAVPASSGPTAAEPVHGPDTAGRVEAIDALRERAETRPLHRVSLRVGEGADATRVRVDLRADQLRADMRTDSVRLAGRLRQDLPELARALERRGLDVETIRVGRGERAIADVAAPRNLEAPRSAESGSSSRNDGGGTQRHAQDERSRSRKERNQEGDE